MELIHSLPILRSQLLKGYLPLIRYNYTSEVIKIALAEPQFRVILLII